MKFLIGFTEFVVKFAKRIKKMASDVKTILFSIFKAQETITNMLISLMTKFPSLTASISSFYYLITSSKQKIVNISHFLKPQNR